MEIAFSEPIDLAGIQAGRLWPFDILRDGGPVTAAVLVSRVSQVDGKANTYLWTFDAASPAWPVHIDSLTLAASPVLHDALGNPGVPGGSRIPVEGRPLSLANELTITVTSPIVSRPVSQPAVPVHVRRNPFAVVGAAPGGVETCLNCPPGAGGVFTPAHPLPEWIIRSKYAFQYSFSIFDHLGNFVGRTEGQVADGMLARVATEPDGLRSLKFRWLPVAANGVPAGSGAYILRGQVFNREQEARKGPQGEPILLSAGRSEVFTTFGYLRQY